MMFNLCVLITIACAVYAGWCASQGKEWLLHLNIPLVVMNVAYVYVNSYMVFVQDMPMFAWYYIINVWGGSMAARGIYRCLN